MSWVDRAKAYRDGARILKDWWVGGTFPVDRELAQSRADVCLKCPMNGDGSGITNSIANAIKEQVELKNKLQLRVMGEKSLKTCKACLCVIRLKIWLPLVNLKRYSDEEEMKRYHEDCWMLKEKP